MVAEVNEGKRVQEVSEGKQQKWLLSASVKSHQETGDKPNLQDTWDFHASDYFCDTGVTCRPTTFTSLLCMKYCCKTWPCSSAKTSCNYIVIMQKHSSNIGMVQVTELKLPLNNQASTLLRYLEHKEEILKYKLYNCPEIMNSHFVSLNGLFGRDFVSHKAHRSCEQVRANSNLSFL